MTSALTVGAVPTRAGVGYPADITSIDRIRILAYLAAAAPLILLPRIASDEWLITLAPAAVVFAALVVLASVATGRVAQRGAWTCLGIGMLSWGIGDSIWDWHELVDGNELPFPSWADVFYLGAVPLLACALYRMGRDGGRSAYRFRALDVAVICTGAGAAIWTLSGSGDEAVAAHGLERLILVAYPTADVVLVGMCAYALMSARRSPALLALTLGVASLVVADVAFVHLVQLGTYDSGSLPTMFWPLGFVLMGLASLLPDGAGAPWLGGADRRSHGLVAMLLLSSLAIAASTAWALAQDLPVDLLLLVGAASMMTIMVIARLTVVSSELRRASDEIQAAHARVDRSNGLRGMLLERAERASEDGRRSLAADLHDGPIQSLAALQYGVEAALLGPDPDLRAIAMQATEGIACQVRELRDIMTWLRPPSLDERGLRHAVSDLAESLADGTGANVSVRCTIEQPLSPARELTVYRLVQEGLRNVARHAHAANVDVDLRSDEHGVHFTVVDDGVGFDQDELAAAPRRGHFGLAFMRERVDLTGGSWVVETNSRGGVTLRAEIPHECDGVDGSTA